MNKKSVIKKSMGIPIKCGFIIKKFNEDPSWTNDKLPGEFTIYAIM